MDDTTRPSIDDDLAAIGSWVGTITPPDHETLVASTTTFEGPRNGAPRWQRGLLAAAAVVVVVVGVWALTRNRGHEEIGDIAGPAAEWTRTAPSPLSPRNTAKSVWTGSEVIVFSGTTQPECPVCDYFAYGDTLYDGAAYDPATDSWRPIADMPADASYIGTAVSVLGDVYYFTQVDPDVQASVVTYALFRYSVADDAWTRVDVPIPFPSGALPGSSPVATPGGLVIASSSGQDAPDLFLDVTTSEWRTIPADPLLDTFGRQYIVVGDDLVLFSQDYERLDNGADVPFWRTARLDLATMTWQETGTAEMAFGPIFAEGTRIVSPFTGGVDGGEVNNWGRTVPNGGILDISTGEEQRLPQPEPEYGSGVIGASTAWFSNTSGSVLDLPTGRWLTIPTLPDGLGGQFGQSVTAMGTDLFTFGGNVDNVVHNASFVWRTRATTTPPDSTRGETPSTAPALRPGDTVVEQTDLLLAGGGLAALEEALGALGIDRDLAPWRLFDVQDPTFCGAEWIRDPYTSDVEGNVQGRDCFWQAVNDGTTALYIFQMPTVEGAPVAWVWRTENGKVSQHVDFTRDSFGSGEWSSNTCFTFERSTQAVPFDCVTTTLGVEYTLAPAGGCGAMGFNAINADQTVALMIYIDQGDAVAADLDRTFAVGDPGVTVLLRRGVNLREMMCSDIISESRVDGESPAIGGTIHVTTSGSGETTCGETSGLAELRDLVFEDGTTVADLDIATTELNCFAG